MDSRQMKGLEIADRKNIRKDADGWLVPSQNGNGFYKVDEDLVCTCPDSVGRGVTCKHAYAVRYYLKAEVKTVSGTIVKEKRPTYPQAWAAYNAAQTSEITQFDSLLRDLVQEVEEPTYEFGRPALSTREQAFCAIQKVYSQLSSRRAVSLYGNAVKNGQLNHKPHFNAVSKFLNREDVTPLLQHLVTLSASPLKAIETSFAVDSTGFRTTCFSEYAQYKYHFGYQHNWLKLHACVGTKTNVITSVEITDEHGSDSPQFPVLIAKTASGGFQVKEASADKAYSSRQNLEAVKAVGGTAYIPFKSNSTGTPDGSMLWRRAFFYFHEHSGEFYEHYHKRSNVESTFAAMKKKFGDSVKSKNRTAQINELLCKVIAFNITCLNMEMGELGITTDFK